MDYFGLVQKAIDMIEENICDKMQVSDLAGAAYCSEAHFSRVFHSIVGMSIMDYIRYRKLSLAGRELVFTTVKVIDVTLKYGYETPEAFTKAFKKYHGISPAECKRTFSYKYQERSFPLVMKMKIMKGEIDMAKFGSAMQEIQRELDKRSENLYFCFYNQGDRFAIHGLSINSIYPTNNLHINNEGKVWQSLWGHDMPVVRLNETFALDEITEGVQNVLWCKIRDSKDRYNKSKDFGLIVDGNPELRVVVSIKETENKKHPYVAQIGQFEDEEIFIIQVDKLRDFMSHQLTDSFDACEKKPSWESMHSKSDDDLQKRLEISAYHAELLARNASIEAVNGMEHHKGTMVVAHELFQHAAELAKIAHALRERNS